MRFTAQAGMILAALGLSLNTAQSEPLSNPPPLPSFCGGILCAEIGKIYAGGAWASPVISTEYALDGRQAHYRIKYPIGHISIDIRPSANCKAADEPNQQRVQRLGQTTAMAAACAKGPNAGYLSIRVRFVGANENDLRAIVQQFGTLWIIDFRPDLVWAKEGVITMGPPVEFAPGAFER
jgi:hypothetical protein